MRRAWTVVLPLLLVAAGSRASNAQVAETTLSRLTAMSSAVCIGRVERVIEVVAAAPVFGDEGVPITTLHVAEVTVETWIGPGEARTRLWYLANASWLCDMSKAIRGERALLFLQPVWKLREQTAAPLDALLAATEGEPLHQLTWSGRGRMPIRRITGVEYAGIQADVVRLPADVELLPGDRPSASRGAWARLEHLLAALEGDPWPSGWERFAGARRAFESREAQLRPFQLQTLLDVQAPLREAAALFAPLDHMREWLREGPVEAARAAAWVFAFHARRPDTELDDENRALLAARGLVHADPEVRWRSLDALAARYGAAGGDVEDVGSLMARALRDADPVVRMHAAEAVTVPYTGDWNRPENLDVRGEVIEALVPLTRSADLRTERAAWAGLAHVGAPIVEEFLAGRAEGLEGLDPVVRVHLVVGLGRLRSPTALARIEAAQAHSDPWTRRAALHALALQRGVAAGSAMERGFVDPDDSVVEAAGLELALLEDAETEAAALAALGRAIESTTEPARRAKLEEIRAHVTR